jgi:hypothetical protein
VINPYKSGLEKAIEIAEDEPEKHVRPEYRFSTQTEAYLSGIDDVIKSIRTALESPTTKAAEHPCPLNNDAPNTCPCAVIACLDSTDEDQIEITAPFSMTVISRIMGNYLLEKEEEQCSLYQCNKCGKICV